MYLTEVISDLNSLRRISILQTITAIINKRMIKTAEIMYVRTVNSINSPTRQS